MAYNVWLDQYKMAVSHGETEKPIDAQSMSLMSQQPQSSTQGLENIWTTTGLQCMLEDGEDDF